MSDAVSARTHPTLRGFTQSRIWSQCCDLLDHGQIDQGTYASFLLAMAGARVIKMEPIGGERLRGRADTPPTLAFAMLNSNKLGVTLDLKKARGRELSSTPESNPRVGRFRNEVLRRRTPTCSLTAVSRSARNRPLPQPARPPRAGCRMCLSSMMTCSSDSSSHDSSIAVVGIKGWNKGGGDN